MDAQKARIVMKYTDLLLLCKCCEVGTRPLYRWFNGPVLLVQRLCTAGSTALYRSATGGYDTLYHHTVGLFGAVVVQFADIYHCCARIGMSHGFGYDFQIYIRSESCACPRMAGNIRCQGKFYAGHGGETFQGTVVRRQAGGIFAKCIFRRYGAKDGKHIFVCRVTVS